MRSCHDFWVGKAAAISTELGVLLDDTAVDSNGADSLSGVATLNMSMHALKHQA